MRNYKYLILIMLITFALVGCQLFMEEAEKGELTVGTPEEGEAWMRLNVECSADYCNPDMPHTLYFYAYEGMHDWSTDTHQADLDYIYIKEENATFPQGQFSKVYKIARNQRQEDFPWPTTRYTGGVYYDLIDGDVATGTHPLGSDVDPQDRSNYILMETDIINDLSYRLYQNPRSDEVIVDFEILCAREECLNNSSNVIKFVFNEGQTEILPIPFPQYYLELPNVPFPNGIRTIVYDSPADISDRTKVWEEGFMTGGAFLDMVDLGGVDGRPARDVEYVPGEDPYDMQNVYENKNGQITYSRLTFPEDPPASENWVHLTVDCDSESIPECNHLTRDGATLKFYMHEGDWETTSEPSYYLEWKNPVFPFELYLKTGETTEGEELIWPVDTVLTGGAYLDMESSAGFLTVEMELGDPKDVCNRYSAFEEGPGKIREIHLTLQADVLPPALGDPDPDAGTVPEDSLSCDYTDH